MIQMALDEIAPGMVLARSILGEGGSLLLAAGFPLNEIIISKLRDMEYSSVWIYEEGTEMVVPEEILSEQLSLQAQGVLQENMDMLRKVNQIQDMTVDNLRKFAGEPGRFKNILAAARVRNVVNEIIDSLMGREPVVVNLASMRSKSGYLYQHALDTTITAIMLGQRLRYPVKDMEELAVGTFLMDFGLVLVADGVYHKRDRLTLQEAALLKEHPTLGYAILKENEGIPITTAHVAYQHHERQDGHGYPRKLRGNNGPPVKNISSESGWILRYAEVAAVADAYISLISPRPGTVAAKSPEEAIRHLITVAGSQLNKSVVDILITMIPVFPVGARVVIVDDPKYRMQGFVAIVAKTRLDDPERPQIVVLFDRDKRKIKPMLLDLHEEKLIKIQFSRIT